jgi:hypothetical protein
MAETEGVKDSFEVVKGLLADLGAKKPEREDALKVAWALKDIYERLMRVRAIAPMVDLSERMWDLMALAGLKAKPVRQASSALRSAATFL